MRYLF